MRKNYKQEVFKHYFRFLQNLFIWKCCFGSFGVGRSSYWLRSGSYSSSSSSIFSSTILSISSHDVGRGSISSASSSSLSKTGTLLSQYSWQFWQREGWEFIESFLQSHLPLLQSLMHRQKIIFKIFSGAARSLSAQERDCCLLCAPNLTILEIARFLTRAGPVETFWRNAPSLPPQLVIEKRYQV